MSFFAFHYIICTKASVGMLHIQSKYWKSLKEIRKQTKNSVDGVSISRLKQGESTWILKLGKVYLCGFKDCLGRECKRDDTNVV